jgi:hypothetical protein
MRCPTCGKFGKEGEKICEDDGTKLVADKLYDDYLKRNKASQEQKQYSSKSGKALSVIGGLL